MQTYELHATAKQVQRSQGRSSVAAAAYRSATRMVDERTGEIHDYRNKQGVEHSRIYTPDNAPDWAKDRTKLWNACEAKENRSNSCTARELEVAFPSEFNAMQRREAGDKVSRELMRRYGCAVDISYHEPNKSGDERNFHAHILFTTRSFDKEREDGWSKNKYRDLNNDKIRVEDRSTTRGKEEVKAMRAFTANEMNRIAQRDHLNVRTEHLSFEERGIDREASQHLGQSATDMERQRKSSRIGNENRKIEQRNALRAVFHLEAVAVKMALEREQAGFQRWQGHKEAQREARFALDDLDLSRKQDRQKAQLENKLDGTYGEHKRTIGQELKAVQARLKRKGAIKYLRSVFGLTRTDKQAQQDYQKTLIDIRRREDEQRGALKKQQRLERKAEQKRQQQRRIAHRKALEKGLEGKRKQWLQRTQTETWKDKIKQTEQQPTPRQSVILERRGLDPTEYNRVSARQKIRKIAVEEKWAQKRHSPARKLQAPPDNASDKKTLSKTWAAVSNDNPEDKDDRRAQALSKARKEKEKRREQSPGRGKNQNDLSR